MNTSTEYQDSPSVADGLQLLIDTLPITIRHALHESGLEGLVEVIMDLGRVPQARYAGRTMTLTELPVSHEDLAHVLALVGEFSADNRAGIEGTLHRISAIRNRKGEIIGLTLRVGRAVFGTIDLIRDLAESGRSLLLLGPPGVGKTTKLREIARVMADDLGKRVIVIDTSNEIAGDGDIPHPAIGGARRMQVPHPDRQHAVMIEAVENHMPEVIIVDEIGTEAEAAAARTIAERGVQLVGTAHGNTLENLVMNPTLADLVGGVQTVTLGDEEARLRGTQKTIAERKGPPTFEQVVEILSRDEVMVHRETAEAVDAILKGITPGGERRSRDGEGGMAVETVAARPMPGALAPTPRQAPPREDGLTRIYPYGVSRDLTERVIRDLRLGARTVSRPEWADMILALRARQSDVRLQRILASTQAPLQLIKKNTTSQIRHTLQSAFHAVRDAEEDEVQAVVKEAEEAIQRVLEEGVAVELPPCRASLRKIQHRIITRHRLVGESVGSEPERHLVVYPAE